MARASEPAGYAEILGAAIAAHRAGQREEAIAGFERAQALYPNARALRGLGVAAFEAGRYAYAATILEQSLHHPVKPLTAELREAVTVLIARARASVGRYRITSVPESITIMVDGQPAEMASDGTLTLDPGRRELHLSADAYEPSTMVLEVVPGGEQTVHVALAATRPDAAQEAGSALAPRTMWSPSVLQPSPLDARLATAPLRPDVSGSPRLRAAAWLTGGLSVASFATAFALWKVGNRRADDVAASCRSEPVGGCTQAVADARFESAHVIGYQRGANALVGVALGATTASIVLWSLYLARRRTPPGARRAALLTLRF